jgi:hypothetical protein
MEQQDQHMLLKKPIYYYYYIGEKLYVYSARMMDEKTSGYLQSGESL